MSIQAENELRRSQPATASGTTLPELTPRMPDPPTVTDIKDTSATITWTEPGTTNLYYLATGAVYVLMQQMVFRLSMNWDTEGVQRGLVAKLSALLTTRCQRFCSIWTHRPTMSSDYVPSILWVLLTSAMKSLSPLLVGSVYTAHFNSSTYD